MLQNLFLSYGSYTGITELILVLWILFLYFGSYTCLTDTGVPVGTTKLILILQSLYPFYRYGSTRRYYWTYTYFTDMGVPVGTTGLILILPIQEYL